MFTYKAEPYFTKGHLSMVESKKDSSSNSHFLICLGCEHIIDFFALDNQKVDPKSFRIENVRQNALYINR